MIEKEKELEEILAAVARYYDSLTDEEIAEDRAWGDFAALQFAVEERSDDLTQLRSQFGIPITYCPFTRGRIA